jgi:hypothetical protein
MQVLLTTFRMDRNEAKRPGNADSAALDQVPRRAAQSFEDFPFSPEAFIPSHLPLAVCDDCDTSANLDAERSANGPSSMQYHVLLILLHRPFLAQKTADNSTSQKSPAASESEQEHAKVCRFAAGKIAQIFRAYRSHYTLVSQAP